MRERQQFRTAMNTVVDTPVSAPSTLSGQHGPA